MLNVTSQFMGIIGLSLIQGVIAYSIAFFLIQRYQSTKLTNLKWLILYFLVYPFGGLFQAFQLYSLFYIHDYLSRILLVMFIGETFYANLPKIKYGILTAIIVISGVHFPLTIIITSNLDPLLYVITNLLISSLIWITGFTLTMSAYKAQQNLRALKNINIEDESVQKRYSRLIAAGVCLVLQGIIPILMPSGRAQDVFELFLAMGLVFFNVLFIILNYNAWVSLGKKMTQTSLPPSTEEKTLTEEEIMAMMEGA